MLHFLPTRFRTEVALPQLQSRLIVPICITHRTHDMHCDMPNNDDDDDDDDDDDRPPPTWRK
jgi:hypothetical protein